MPIALTPSAIALLGLVAWSLLLAVLLLNLRCFKVLTGHKAVTAFNANGSCVPGIGQRIQPGRRHQQ